MATTRAARPSGAVSARQVGPSQSRSVASRIVSLRLMFDDLRQRYPWVLPTFRYQTTATLLASLREHVIESAEQKVKS
jgi:hypothetical protein